jgi:hypothetical protein
VDPAYALQRGRLGGGGRAAQRGAEAYRLEILDGTTPRRTIEPASPHYSYTAEEQVADFGGPATAFTVRVAQVSAAAGAGFTMEEVVHV